MRDYQIDPGLGCASRQLRPHNLPKMQRLSIFQQPSAIKASSGVGSLKRETMVPALPIQSRYGATFAPIRRSALLQLQHTHGNRYVQRMLQLAREPEGESSVAPDVERTIESTRGGGHALDSSARGTMGSAFNADFSAVRVHTNSQADSLNQSLNARAFTTGQDIYFKQGQYNPGSSSGKELLAHELTHVVQQNGDKIQGKYEDEPARSGCGCSASGTSRSMQAKLTVSHPGDVYEQEADRAGQAYAKWEQQSSPAAGSGESVGRQAVEEEKKEESPVMAKFRDGWVLRQAEAVPEEEKEEGLAQSQLQKDGVQRQVEEEEEQA
jgi:hypothetical protein